MQFLFILSLLAVLLAVLMFYRSVTAKIPTTLGVVDGRLAPEPSSPNCVLTQTDSEQHRMSPVNFAAELPADKVIDIIRATVNEFPNASVVTATETYLHAEFVSTFFRFVDDVEFFVDEDASVIHFRSASRVGYSDLGVNRQRMQSLVKSLNQKLSAH